ERAGDVRGIAWERISPDARNTWLRQGLRDDWDDLIPLGTKAGKAGRRDRAEGVIFRMYSNGILSGNDAYVYNHDRDALIRQARAMVADYRAHLARYTFEKRPDKIEDFLKIDESVLKWIRRTKRSLQREISVDFDPALVRTSLYRPFDKQHYYFERVFSEEIYQFPRILPTPQAEQENLVICVAGVGNSKGFGCLMTNVIPDLHLTGDSQCFPLYEYDEEGRRHDNITDWALAHVRGAVGDAGISKEDIFYWVYGALHDPTYRATYAQNLKRDLPRLRVGDDFWDVAQRGRRLAQLHVHYETVEPYPLTEVEKTGVAPSYRVGQKKMRLIVPKEADAPLSLVVNDFLTLADIPRRVLDYKLGNRSALEWVIEQYHVKKDARSGIVNDPNRPDEPRYIVDLIKRVVRVSLETLALIHQAAPLDEAA
ncbi:MAG: type ISP restriction/modification enzyme, partial [Anaerolineae bacterium]